MESSVATADGTTRIRPQRRTADSTDCFLGIDLGGTKLRLLLADHSGSELGRFTETLSRHTTPAEIISLIDRSSALLLNQSNRDRTCLRSVGAGVPGVTNVQDGVVRLAPFLSGWKDVPFGHLLQDRLQTPAYVDNDVNLAAMGEAHEGVARSRQDFVFLALGTGFGAGIYLRGELHRGADWTSGELGYMRLCGCCDSVLDANHPGPLESIIGGPAIEQAWRRLAQSAGLPPNLSATEIFQLSHPLAKQLLDTTAGLLSEAIVTVSLVLNCPLFVLGGGVGRSPQLLHAVEQKLAPHPIVHPKVKLSQLGHDAQLAGAVRLAISHHEASATSFL